MFVSVRGTASNEIYVMNADGSGQTRLTTNGSNIVPSWSPDGTKIVYQHGSDIWTMNANGSGQVNVSNDPVYATEPTWSPDGTKIAFSSFRDDDYEIYVMNADGSGQVRITNSAGVDFPVDWQPVCTFPLETDTDGDALPDCWELTGDLDDDGDMDVNLPAMGADPDVKDIFVEVDWMDCAVGGSSGCSVPHDESLDVRAQENVIAAFWCAPERIVMHIDAGPDSIMNPSVDSCETRRVSGPTWGSLSEGAAIAHTTTGLYGESVTALMDSVRVPVFHHGFIQHTSAYPPYWGYALPEYFSLAFGTLTFPHPITKTERHEQQSITFMHELGHQLGLTHDGTSGGNHKPNYLSVMNYSFSKFGLIVNGTINRTFDYSRWTLDPLDETSLNESVGLEPDSIVAAGGKFYGTMLDCSPGTAGFDYHAVVIAAGNADWDCDGVEDGAAPGTCIDVIDNGPDGVFDQFDSDCLAFIETSVSADVDGNSTIDYLLSSNDWANLNFGFGSIGPAGGAAGDAFTPSFDSEGTDAPLPDGDGDGLLDMAEPENGTGSGDPDSDDDGVEDGDEVGVYLTDPLAEDSDGDGCPDGRELGTNKLTGGLRYPRNDNDYFNPSGDGLNRVDDILLIVQAYFDDDDDGNPGLPPYEPGYNPAYDRTLVGPNAWNLGPPNGLQRVDDILNQVKQYFHDCS